MHTIKYASSVTHEWLLRTRLFGHFQPIANNERGPTLARVSLLLMLAKTIKHSLRLLKLRPFSDHTGLYFLGGLVTYSGSNAICCTHNLMGTLLGRLTTNNQILQAIPEKAPPYENRQPSAFVRRFLFSQLNTQIKRTAGLGSS